MAEFQTALPPDNIFLLDKDKPFADASIETWTTIISMFGDLHEERARYPPDHDRQKVTDELCRKNPFLKFTKGKPRPGNPYWEFTARVYAWGAAFDALGYGQFKQDHDDDPWFDDYDGGRTSFPKSTNKLSQADCEWLWNPIWFVEGERFFAYGDFEGILWNRPFVSNRKDLLLRRYAYGELWDFTQRLKLQDLTSAQEQDRQKLELWTISRIKETLIAYELEPVCPSRLGESDVESDEIYDEYKKNPTAMEFLLKAKAVATRIVERRIAKGNWQVRGAGKYKFKFNGIETNASCCEPESMDLD